MSAVQLALLIVDRTPPGASAAWREAVVVEALTPLLDALDARPNLRLGLHLTGTMAEHLAENAAALLDRIRRRSREGRLEIIGGARWGAPLSGIPWADALFQLRQHQEWLTAQMGTPVRGVWPALCNWDPLLPRMFAQVGFKYSFVDRRLALASGAEVAGAGPVLAERDGAGVQLLCVDPGLGRRAAQSPRALVDMLRLHRLGGRRRHAAAVPLDTLDAARIDRLCRTLADPSIRLHVPWQLLEAPNVGHRVSPIPGLPLESAAARLGPVAAQQFLDAADRWTAGPTWSAVLGHHDAAGRLHAAAQRASTVVVAAARRAGREESPEGLQGAQRARLLLSRGQSAYAMEPGPGGQLWDPAVRAAAWSALQQAEDRAWRLGGQPRCHVHEPAAGAVGGGAVIVRTPDLAGVIEPARGGALTSLTLWGEHQLLNTLARPTLDPAEGGEVLPVLLDEELAEDLATEPTADLVSAPAPEADGGAELPVEDRLPRLAFQDRIFGTPLTLSNLRRSQPPEIGDFADGAYRVEQARKVDGGVEVSLGREGTARAHAGSEGLLRITKTWRFSGHAPVLSVDYQLGNRSRDPVRARFGVTLTVNVDGQLGASRVVRLPGGRPLPFDHAFEQDDVGRFGLVFADLGFELQLRATPAVTLLAYPVRVPPPPDPVLAPWAEGRARSPFQGICLNLVWPMDLWGEERRKVTVELEARSLGGR